MEIEYLLRKLMCSRTVHRSVYENEIYYYHVSYAGVLQYNIKVFCYVQIITQTQEFPKC